MFYLISISILAAFGFLGWGLDLEARRRYAVKTTDIQEGVVDVNLHELELTKPFTHRVVLPIGRSLQHFLLKATPAEFLQYLEKLLSSADSNFKAGDILLFQFGGALITASVLGLFITNILIIFGCALFWCAFPVLLLHDRVRARVRQIEAQLPDAMDLLCISMEAGLGLDMAFGKVVEKLHGPVGIEFAKVLHEIAMGAKRSEALKHLGERVPVTDLRQFITVIVQSDKLGLPLANVLKVQSSQLRVRRRLSIEERAMKAPLKMSVVLVLFILPALMVLLLGPALIQFMTQFGGLAK